MISIRRIRAVAARIAREFHPERVVLFGSHARGRATEDSDVDLLVVMPFKGRSVDKAVEVRLRAEASFPMDILVRTPGEVRRRIAMGDAFMQDVLTNGKVLYEADHN